MKRIVMALTWLSLTSMPLWAMPSQITFQGTLKQKGVPVNVTKNMQFSFVDSLGSSIPGTTPISVANVQVTNGLFAVQLPIDPTIPWEQYSTFIQVSVEGQILNPNQPLNANLYAVSAIPQGMIAMFNTSCPGGWTRLSDMDGRFPHGNSVYGGKGGSATHNHGGQVLPWTGHGATAGGYDDGKHDFPDYGHTHAIPADSNIPPYLDVFFCVKQ